MLIPCLNRSAAILKYTTDSLIKHQLKTQYLIDCEETLWKQIKRNV